jgi:hypothetical protein
MNATPTVPYLPNRLQVTFTTEERRVVDTGLEGHRHLIKSVEYWIDVGKAMNILYLKAERIGRKAFVALQLQEGFVTREGKPIDKGLISKARQMADHADAVKAWKATLTPKQQATWNNPNSVFLHCPLFAKTSHPPRQTRQMPATPKTEDQLRAQELAQAQARIAELEAKLAEDRRRPARTAGGGARPAAFTEEARLRAQNAELRRQINLLRPTVDGEVVKLRKEVEELRGERVSLHRVLKQVAKERDQHRIIHSSPLLRVAADGKLKRATYRKIVQCLHHDSRRARTEAQLDEAAVLFIELEDLFQFEPK